jgi:putative oxidoreductase
MVYRLYAFFLTICRWLSFLPPLTTRLVIGLVFVWSGINHLHNIDGFVANFKDWGIPAPEFQARFSAGTELVCGGLVTLGLCTRLAAIPLMVVMANAIWFAYPKYLSDIVAARGDFLKLLGNVDDLFGLAEFLYIVLLSWLVIYGPGWMSIDRLIAGDPAKAKAQEQAKEAKKE